MLHIEPTKTTPKVLYTAELAELLIAGESYPENSFAFFRPVFEWLHTELPLLERLTLKVNISYMNSSSTKCVLDILDLLSEAAQRGCETKVVWYYEHANPRGLDLAEEFREDMQLPFEIVGVDSTADVR